ncbi:hypothetical protein IV494_08385 [Kaistella sp. G5-32]|uniref:Pectate lyase superfamily protein domain-containing protein n=1 Tax=Kaistella gelatinilytica TaxID=2787636 RepID=A0ABS0FBW1_9FLAO|nr:hypothetical protein [Kaistella gelatinilytica]MBF8457199.1 hypothetical protein [Kaistella gelatinilytica]
MGNNLPKLNTESDTSHNKIINIEQFQVFPIKGSSETDEVKYERWLNIKKAFEYCIENKYDLYFPKGTYDVGVRNFPFRQEEGKGNQMKDCKSITIFGDGRGTILKTASVFGADVLQLNMVKNLTIKNFDITAELSSTKKAGSNGISITNGFDNIVLDNIYIYNLPGIDKGNYIDGGKGLTLQFDPNIDSVKGSLLATNIKVKNCAYGFRFDAVSVSDILKGNINIKLQIEADRTFQGFSMSFGVPTENVKPGSKLVMDVDAVLSNSQQYVSFSRVIGGNYRFTLDKTIDNKYINKDQNNKVWYKADPLFFAFLSNYSKDTNTTIRGNVGAVDSKIWMGAVGSVVEPLNLKNRTENNIFNFDIVGISSDEDFKLIEYQGNSINNSKINFTPRTLKKKLTFEKIKKNNSIIMK